MGFYGCLQMFVVCETGSRHAAKGLQEVSPCRESLQTGLAGEKKMFLLEGLARWQKCKGEVAGHRRRGGKGGQGGRQPEGEARQHSGGRPGTMLNLQQEGLLMLTAGGAGRLGRHRQWAEGGGGKKR